MIIRYFRLSFAVLLLLPLFLEAQKSGITVDSATTSLDASVAPYNQVMPGDTVFLEGGAKHHLLIKNFTGTAEKPIVFINTKGEVRIDTDHYYGILIEKCLNIKLSGGGDADYFYGIRIEGVEHGAGLSISMMSSEVEAERLYIANTAMGGIYAKTDPDCSFAATREKFTQFNTRIHDCYLDHVASEGMYIGSTKYFGQVVNCNGVDTLLLPHLLRGVRIYNNIVTYSGWDGIQVSSASSDCQVYDNIVLYDSEAEMINQMSGIILGGGSKCDCYNNYIAYGKGIGIENHGLGGNRIFNNIIVDAGLTYKPGEPDEMKYGIYVTDVSTQPDSSYFLLFNTIVNPKSDGIRFNSRLSRHNEILSNAIINPGNFDYYENGGFSVKGIDSYVMLPYSDQDVVILNNYFNRTLSPAFFSDSLFRLSPFSPLCNAASPALHHVSFDFDYKPRPYGKAADIGAFELQQVDSLFLITDKLKYYPNPANQHIQFEYWIDNQEDINLYLYNSNGQYLLEKHYPSQGPGRLLLMLDVSTLASGLYLYTLSSSSRTLSGKILKR
jgi:hypothetical protein